MPRKLIFVDLPEMDLRNVVFLGDSRFNTIQHKRVLLKNLTEDEKNRIICYEACRYRDKKTNDCDHGCDNRCVWAVVKMTPIEQRNRKADLKKIFPHMRF